MAVRLNADSSRQKSEPAACVRRWRAAASRQIIVASVLPLHQDVASDAKDASRRRRRRSDGVRRTKRSKKTMRAAIVTLVACARAEIQLPSHWQKDHCFGPRFDDAPEGGPVVALATDGSAPPPASQSSAETTPASTDSCGVGMRASPSLSRGESEHECTGAARDGGGKLDAEKREAARHRALRRHRQPRRAAPAHGRPVPAGRESFRVRRDGEATGARLLQRYRQEMHGLRGAARGDAAGRLAATPHAPRGYSEGGRTKLDGL